MNTTNDFPMHYRIGTSDTYLSPIGLGTWQFSQGRGLVGKFWPQLDNALTLSIVEEAVRHGINWFDTAEIYGKGASEEALATALETLGIAPEESFIATKWWPLLRSARSIDDSIAERIRRLHGRPITLYQIHQPHSRSSMADQMRAMARLLDQGLIAHAGVSNFSRAQMVQAHRLLKSYGHGLASNQVRYNLLDRRIEKSGLLDAARDLGVSIIAYSPLAQGLLSGKFHHSAIRPKGLRKMDPHFRVSYLKKTEPLIRVIEDIAHRREVTPSQVALNWIISAKGEMVFAIPGATRVSQAVENAGAMRFALNAEERERLDKVSAEIES